MRAAIASLAYLALALGACEIDTGPPPPLDVGTFPYDPLVYQLDLSILAYQLHGQSLVWPIDPYYEEHASDRGTSRLALMALIRDWLPRRAQSQIDAMAGLDAYRGPGALAGLDDNPTHDPIVYDYARVHPWSDAIVNMDGRWTEYLTPRAITGRIRDVYVSARPIGDGTRVELFVVPPAREDWDPDAADVLCAFEGGTGDRGDPGRPVSYSLMGFVLARATVDGYDAHITFRGSRSGSAERAALEALSTDDARGNPDWITDLGWDTIDARSGAAAVTAVGGVHRGFAHSMTSILPAAFQCIARIAELRGDVPPNNVYVSGHSLGGGLALHFASAVLLGEEYGPAGAGPAMPAALRAWPWSQLKLVTFSAPRAGDHTWAAALSDGALDAPFYDPGPIETVDADALVVFDPSIVARMLDASRPAGFRVLISTDPITTTRFGGPGNHVGTTVYVNGTSFIDWIGIDDPASHEPANVRGAITSARPDPRTPPVAFRYLALDELVPDRDPSEMGTPREMEKLAAGLRAYYADRALWLDEVAFSRDLELLFAIERGGAN